jgi:hypothetical protein
MAYSDGLVTGQSGFEHTPDVVTLGFVTVGVTQMRLDAGNPITKSAYRALDAGVSEGNDRFTPSEVIVRINLNLHGAPSLT